MKFSLLMIEGFQTKPTLTWGDSLTFILLGGFPPTSTSRYSPALPALPALVLGEARPSRCRTKEASIYSVLFLGIARPQKDMARDAWR